MIVNLSHCCDIKQLKEERPDLTNSSRIYSPLRWGNMTAGNSVLCTLLEEKGTHQNHQLPNSHRIIVTCMQSIQCTSGTNDVAATNHSLVIFKVHSMT